MLAVSCKAGQAIGLLVGTAGQPERTRRPLRNHRTSRLLQKIFNKELVTIQFAMLLVFDSMPSLSKNPR
jgi:hypothetical protein